MCALKGQNLPIMNAVMFSLTLHALAGWAFLKIAQDITNHVVVPPIEFFVVPPPTPEHVIPVVPQALPKQKPKKMATHRQQVLPPPVIVTRPARENPVAPSQIKQKVEAAPLPSPVLPIAASPQAKEPSSLHSVPASATATTAHVASSTPAVSRSATVGNNDTGTVVGPSYGAAYLHNPSPPYPPVARKHKLQGTAVIRVLVSPEGQPKSVELEKTSGVRILDDAAVEAVKRWSFVPARRGNVRITAWVDVPIRFHLE